MSSRKIVRIHQETSPKKLSAAQKRFNSLIKKIDTAKKRLIEWKNAIPVYQSRVVGEYDQAWDTYNQYRIELVQVFDRAYGDKQFTKAEKNKLKHLILDIGMELIAEHGFDDLKPLYNKYSDTDFDALKQGYEQDVNDMMKSMLETVFDVELDDDVDVASPEAFASAVRAKLEAKNAEMERLTEQNQSKRKKTAKQIEKEEKQRQEAQNTSKSIQEVYRKLAGSLHPDREPDEQERERKTKLMQQVNAAYAKKDLLQLLELQLEIEQIDQSQLNNIAEDRLKHFNKVLHEQLRELDDEIEQLELTCKMQVGLPPFHKLTPKQFLSKLDYDISDVKNDIRHIQLDLERFQMPKLLKSWLKTYTITEKDDFDDFDDWLFNPFK